LLAFRAYVFVLTQIAAAVNFVTAKAGLHDAVQGRRRLIASATTPASGHEYLTLVGQVLAGLVGGQLELFGHGNGVFGADVGAAPAEDATLQQPGYAASDLVKVLYFDQARRADRSTRSATDSLVHIHLRVASEALVRGMRFGRIGQSDPSRQQTYQSLLELA